MWHIGQAMIERNKEKYGDFLSTFDSIKALLRINFVPHVEDRVRLFRLTYFVCRLIDDVIDGDTKIKDIQKRNEYITTAFDALDENYSENIISLMIQESLKISDIL
jgi:hypothetical protein